MQSVVHNTWTVRARPNFNLAFGRGFFVFGKPIQIDLDQGKGVFSA
jgi:hypothetical protein